MSREATTKCRAPTAPSRPGRTQITSVSLLPEERLEALRLEALRKTDFTGLVRLLIREEAERRGLDCNTPERSSGDAGMGNLELECPHPG